MSFLFHAKSFISWPIWLLKKGSHSIVISGLPTLEKECEIAKYPFKLWFPLAWLMHSVHCSGIEAL